MIRGLLLQTTPARIPDSELTVNAVMCRPFRYMLTGLWIAVATIGLGRWWMTHPDTFPPLPEAFWQRLETWYGATCCESQADLEARVVLAAAFITTTLLTVIMWIIWRRITPAGVPPER